jgi:membrane protease YdiL (CAAX protease family)
MSEPDPGRTTVIALLFEGGLGLAAFAIGWLFGHWPAIGMDASSGGTQQHIEAIGWGLVATGPLVIALVAIDRIPFGPLLRLRELTEEVVMQMFQGASLMQLAVVSIAAGFGEELLFRGLVQAGLSSLVGGPLGPWLALAAASVLFGVCHWLNTTYAILAVLAGAYFGVLFMLTGNLWTPIIAHAAYDLLALIYLVRPSHLVQWRGDD